MEWWVAHADALFVKRMAVPVTRLVFDLMAVVPAEYAIRVRDRSQTIMHTLFARSFGVPLATPCAPSLSFTVGHPFPSVPSPPTPPSHKRTP